MEMKENLEQEIGIWIEEKDEEVPPGRVSDQRYTYNPHKDLTSLKAWQDCREVKLFFYEKVLPLLPSEERYNLNLQIRKATSSITANIAEGYGRFHYQEGIQFYRISRGSLYELKDHLISCFDLDYVDSTVLSEGGEKIENAKKSVNGFIRYTKGRIKSKG